MLLTNTWTGNLEKVVIPRPDPSGAPVAGVGKVSLLFSQCGIWFVVQMLWAILIYESSVQVFLEYADVDGSTRAKTGMHGRKFGGNQVIAVFYPENKFAAQEYDG